MGLTIQFRFLSYVFQVVLFNFESAKIQSEEEQIVAALKAAGMDGPDKRLKDEDGEPTMGFGRGV